MRQGPKFPRSGGLERRRSEGEWLKSARGIERDGYSLHVRMHDSGGEDPKQYHTSEHLDAVTRRAERIADIFKMAKRARALMRIAIAWHDMVMEYDAADPGDVVSRIRRRRGAREGDLPSGADGNEARSARLLRKAMEDANRAEPGLFGAERMSVAAWAIDATYPDVHSGPFRDYPYYDQAIGQNSALADLFAGLGRVGISAGPLFLQPHLEAPLERGEKVPREVLVVALSDLDGCGMISREKFFAEGDREMRELHANLRDPARLGRVVGGAGEQDRIDRAKVKEECSAWLKGQAGFAAWQALRFEKILYLLKKQGDLSVEEEQALRHQFGRFAANARAASDRAARLLSRYDASARAGDERRATADLLKEMGI